MDKAIINLSFLTMITASGLAQTAEIKIKAREAEIPVAVVQSFKKDFANAAAEQWTITPASIIGEEYVVARYNNLHGEKPTFYAVRIKGPNVRGEAVYDASGELLHSKEVIKDTALPLVVEKAIAERYPGYAMTGDRLVVKSGKSTISHYQVQLEKGKSRKTVAIDSIGKVIKEFDMRS